MKTGHVTALEDVDASGLRIGIVAARFNADIVERLLDAAVTSLVEQGAAEGDVDVHRVPGAFEVPVVLAALARSERFDALVALATVIRGETPHFDYVCTAVTTGAEAVARDFLVPVGFGVLTTDTPEQASQRAGGNAGNKGREAALSAVATVRVLQNLT